MGKADTDMKYLFPFDKVNKGSCIVLYGAGDIGYDFFRQIKSSDYCRLMLWLDKQYEMYRIMGLPVDEPEQILKCDYEYVVIAALSDETYNSISGYLMSMGVPAEKIIWEPDVLIGFDIALKYDRARAAKESETAYLSSPESLVDEKRMDIVVRYIYAKEILEGMDKGKGKCLYEKMYMAINGACEPTDNFLFRFFSDYDRKQGLDEFEASFYKVVKSVKNEGFFRSSFIPLTRDGKMINGSHRLAAALAAGCCVWVRKYPFDGVRIVDFKYTFEWLKDAGFSDNDLMVVKKAYNDIKENSYA